MCEDDDELSAQSRLSRNILFRRFLIERSLRLIDGTACPIQPGRRFDGHSIFLCGEGDGDDMRSMQTNHIASSLQLGPLTFLEFCSHAAEQTRTSLRRSGNATSDLIQLPISQLSLRVFAACVGRMALHIPGHPLTATRRVTILIKQAILTTSDLFPKTKSAWEEHLKGEAGLDELNTYSEEDSDLQRVLLAMCRPIVHSKVVTTDSISNKVMLGGLMTELIGNGMDGEAAECADFITYAASTAQNPNLRQRFAVYLLRCWGDEIEVGAPWKGPLGLDHDATKSNFGVCASSAVKCAQQAIGLGGLLDADTPIPLNESTGNEIEVTKERAVVDLPLCCVRDWPENHQLKMKHSTNCDVGHNMPSVVHKATMAMLVRLGIGHNFEDNFNADRVSPLIGSSSLSCFDIIISSPVPNGLTVSRHVGTAAGAVASAIDECLADAEFAVTKTLPYLIGEALDRAQTFVSGRLQAAAKVVGTASACAVSVDDDGTFASELLKVCRRLYALLGRLVQSHMAKPKRLVSSVNQRLLKELAERTTPRIMNLLLSVQEKSEAGEGKYIADRRLESQGRVAAHVVFEKEKSDNALMKACKRMESLGLEKESSWLEGKVVVSTSRDFRIRQQLIKEARVREAPSKRGSNKTKDSSGSKRKSTREKGTTKKKNKKIMNESNDSSSEMDDETSAGDKSCITEAEAGSDDGEDDDGDLVEASGDDLTDTDEESIR